MYMYTRTEEWEWTPYTRLWGTVYIFSLNYTACDAHLRTATETTSTGLPAEFPLLAVYVQQVPGTPTVVRDLHMLARCRCSVLAPVLHGVSLGGCILLRNCRSVWRGLCRPLFDISLVVCRELSNRRGRYMQVRPLIIRRSKKVIRRPALSPRHRSLPHTCCLDHSTPPHVLSSPPPPPISALTRSPG